MAQHLNEEDPKIGEIVGLLKDILGTPSEVVQVTASEALTPLAKKIAADPDNLAALVQYFLRTLTQGSTFGARRGAAFGIAGLVKGTGIAALKKQGIIDAVKAAADVKSDKGAKEGGLMAIECLCAKLGRMFEPYIITILPMLLAAFNDSSPSVCPLLFLSGHIICSRPLPLFPMRSGESLQLNMKSEQSTGRLPLL